MTPKIKLFVRPAGGSGSACSAANKETSLYNDYRCTHRCIQSVLSTFPVFKKIKSNVALMQNLQIIVVHIEGHWIIMEIFVFCFVCFIL